MMKVAIVAAIAALFYIQSEWAYGAIITMVVLQFLLVGRRFWRRRYELRDLIIYNLQLYEIQQLGYSLDDPYWETHKKPSFWQLLKGGKDWEEKEL